MLIFSSESNSTFIIAKDNFFVFAIVDFVLTKEDIFARIVCVSIVINNSSIESNCAFVAVNNISLAIAIASFRNIESSFFQIESF